MSKRLEFTTLVELLRWRAEDTPEKLAYTYLVDGERQEVTLTYGELDRQARLIAGELQRLGVSGERALLLYPPGLEFISAFLGCLYAGVVAVPAYPPDPNRLERSLPRLQAIITDAQPMVVLTTPSLKAMLRLVRSQNPLLDLLGRLPLPKRVGGTFLRELSTIKSTEIVKTGDLQGLNFVTTNNLPSKRLSEFQMPDLRPDTLAYLQYSSGSTGTPKGVMISHRNMLANVVLGSELIDVSSQNPTVGWVPLYHDLGLLSYVGGTIYQGLHCILMSPLHFLQRPIRWLEAISRYKATHNAGPNFGYEYCVRKTTPEERATLDLSHWELAGNGGEPVRHDTLTRFVEAFAPSGFQAEAFYPTFGMAEAVLYLTGAKNKHAPPLLTYLQSTALSEGRITPALPQSHDSQSIVSCGRTGEGHKIMIVDPETLRPSPPDRVGEIWFSGPSVAQGYWNRPQVSAQTFKAYLAGTGEGPFLRTGDLGFIRKNQDQEDELFVTGRIKDLIIIRGRNHYPQDLELTVERSHPALRLGCGAAFSVEIENEERLVVVQEVKPTPLQDLDVNAVFDAIRQTVLEEHDLAVYAILLLEKGSIPKTSSGKIQRHACRMGFLNESLKVVGKWQASPKHFDSLSSEQKNQPPVTSLDLSMPRDAKGAEQIQTKKRAEAIQAWLVAKMAEQLDVPPASIDLQIPFVHLGLDSMAAVSLSGELETWLERPLSPTLAYDYPTIEALASYLASDTATDRQQAPDDQRKRDAIAVIGIGCRFPGADNPEAFWQLLRDGVDAITEVPAARWDVDAFYDATPITPGKMNTRWGGFLADVEQFDAHFFGISPREAENMDPQQRLLLEVSWEALENAGIAPNKLAGSQSGVFIGISSHDYTRLTTGLPEELNAYGGTGNAWSVAANRLSYLLDLHGPSWAVDTACSSSLVAVHQAVMSLRQRECHLALVGGVNVILSPETTISFSQARMMASDGRCKAFDARADGYVRGEGCGMVILKRLADAQRDGDRIIGLIRGTAVNQDGRSNGLTVPNGRAQQAVIRQALANAGVVPAQISYVEAHGTGTPLGDPIEMNALKEVLMQGRSSEPCLIASVKSNIGHLEAASGIAGFIKAILTLSKGEIPAHLHFKELNPHIQLANTPLSIPTERISWPQPPQNGHQAYQTRLAGLNSFGFGGTNAHVILSSVPVARPQATDFDPFPHILTLSAKSKPALQALTQRYVTYLASYSDVSLADLCFAANTGRTHFKHRLAIVADSTLDLRDKLAAFATNDNTAAISGHVEQSQPRIVFLFTGQGSQYVDMGRQLYETHAIFRQTIEQCDEILRAGAYLPQPLLSILYLTNRSDDFSRSLGPEPHPRKSSLQFQGSNLLNQTAYTQPALFALEYALAQVWMSWGIKPDVVMGHSVGELVAACVAGVLSLEDGLKLIAERGRLMDALPRDGEMVVLFASEKRVQDAIRFVDNVSIATINGPQNVVISGERQAVRQIREEFERQGIRTRKLEVSHAFHSPLMQPMLADFEKVASEITYSAPKIDLISLLTGELITDKAVNAEYWVRHVRQPVRFMAGVETLHQMGADIWVEIGPKPTLLGMARHLLPAPTLRQAQGTAPNTRGGERFSLLPSPSIGGGAGGGGRKISWLPSLRPNADWATLTNSLAKAYMRGVEVDWEHSPQHEVKARRRVVLPTYPFQRERYWIVKQSRFTQGIIVPESQKIKSRPVIHPLLGERLRSPLKQILFESTLSPDSPAYLADHRIFGEAILPAAAYIEIALAAGSSFFKSDQIAIKEMGIQKPLLFSNGSEQTLQLVLNPLDQQGAEFQLFSLVEEEGEESAWVLHASGKLVKAEREEVGELAEHSLKAEESGVYRSEILRFSQNDKERVDHATELSVERFYEQMEGRGIDYGPSFRLVQSLWLGENELIGQVELAKHIDPAGYTLHPTLLDACFQVLGAAQQEEETYLPIGVERLQLYRPATAQLWVRAQLRRKTPTVLADLQLFDENRALVATVSGLACRLASPAALLQQNVNRWLYQIAWQPKPLEMPSHDKQVKNGQNWLIFADRAGIGKKLAFEMEKDGLHGLLIYAGYAYQKISANEFIVNPAAPAHFEQLLADARRQDEPYGVVYLWSLKEDDDSGVLCANVLHLVQALAKAPSKKRLWLVTRGAQPVAGGAVAFRQAPLWGLGKVIALEHPELKAVCLDLAPDEQAEEADAVMLKQELLNPDADSQVAYRNNMRHVARLVRYRSPEMVDGPFQVKLSEYGILDNLHLAPITPQTPKADEVEIEVRATGLNFRDVLNALGMLKEYYAEHLDIHDAAEISFGFESAGVIKRIGAGVSNFKIGDDVVAMARGSLTSLITVPAEFVVHKPEILTNEEAATIPIAFLTAYYGLHHLAQIKRGDRVLIHAAAGGVGQAAVQLAMAAGAKLFATASPGKWKFLKAMGIQHVMNSRTLDFAEEVMSMTHGQGVDIVLNTLNGEFVDKSFAVLAKGGRFIELGKIGIWSEEQVQDARPDAAYFPFDLGEVMAQNPALISSMYTQLMDKFDKESLRPLPLKAFPIQKVKDAFRYMAQAKHIGKVVVSQAKKSQEQAIRADGSYLITGGLGALGRQVAHWLIKEGARHLLLTGRSASSDHPAVRELEEAGAQIVVVQADVANQEDLKRVFAQSPTPLRGIVHAAGVLDDGVLMNQSAERVAKVMAPKVQGTWNLHLLSQESPLDFFVCFSSAASLVGSPGQANYAAANAFMDALMHHRHAQGLPGLSINWGPWAEEGMAARQDARWTQFGVDAIAKEQGLQLLSDLIKNNQQTSAQMGVLPVNWPKFMRVTGSVPFLEAVAPQPKQKASDFLKQLKAASDGRALLISHLRSEIAKVLGITNVEQIELRDRLFDLGLDSLMAIELKNRLEANLELTLQPTLLFDYPTLEELGGYLAEEVLGPETTQQEEEKEDKEQVEANQEELAIEEEVKGLSVEELMAQISEEFDAYS